MDWLTFIDHLIGHLAWPLVVAGLVVFLSLRHRAALDILLHRVRKARAGPFEAELEEAKAEADRASLPPAPPVRSPPDRDPLSPEEVEEMQRMRMEDTDRWLGFFMEVAERDPFTAVHGSYHRLNVYLYQAAQRLDPERVRRVEVAQGPLGAAAAEVVGLLTREHEKVLHRSVMRFVVSMSGTSRFRVGRPESSSFSWPDWCLPCKSVCICFSKLVGRRDHDAIRRTDEKAPP